MENPVQPVAYDDEIDLWQLWDTIWSGRWLIVDHHSSLLPAS